MRDRIPHLTRVNRRRFVRLPRLAGLLLASLVGVWCVPRAEAAHCGDYLQFNGRAVAALATHASRALPAAVPHLPLPSETPSPVCDQPAPDAPAPVPSTAPTSAPRWAIAWLSGVENTPTAHFWQLGDAPVHTRDWASRIERPPR